MKILNKFNKSYNLTNRTCTNKRNYSTTLILYLPRTELLTNSKGQRCFKNELDADLNLLENGWSDEFVYDLQELYTKSRKLDFIYDDLHTKIIPKNLLNVEVLGRNAIIQKFKSIEMQEIETYRKEISKLQHEVKNSSYNLYDNMCLTFENLEGAWSNCHLIHYYHYELNRMSTDVDLYLTKQQISAGVARMVEISDTYQFGLFLGEAVMSGNWDPNLEWCYSFKP